MKADKMKPLRRQKLKSEVKVEELVFVLLGRIHIFIVKK